MGRLTPTEWRRAGGLAACVLTLHVIGYGTLLLLVVPRHLSVGHAGVFGPGLGVTAYTLGLRHAFDADHIAAIDNATRKLMTEGKRPLGVGFFFSLGHSTVVFVLALLLTAGVRALGSQLQRGGSTLHQLTALIGPGVSGVFLYLLAAINAAILLGIAKVLRQVPPGGAVDRADLERQLDP